MVELMQQSFTGDANGKGGQDLKDIKDGKYHLVGPDNQVILPLLWEHLVEPGWKISMKMWDSNVPEVQAPIKFKDAVGRKFSFPFHLCQTWDVCPNLFPPPAASDILILDRAWKNSSNNLFSMLMSLGPMYKKVTTI